MIAFASKERLRLLTARRLVFRLKVKGDLETYWIWHKLKIVLAESEGVSRGGD